MIKEIEGLMTHWGEQRRSLGLASGVGSQMGMIMEWKGLPPRGTPSSRVPGGGMGVDHITSEIEAAVAELKRRDEQTRGPRLATLAVGRYVQELSRREQMRDVGIPEGADRTYRNWVTALHQEVMAILIVRSGRNRAAARMMRFQLTSSQPRA